MFAKNYIIDSTEWKPLSDIMAQDYDHEKDYIIYVNEYSGGMLHFTHRSETPNLTDIGKEIPCFTTLTITADTGDHIYFKKTYNNINIEISETA